jgi:hypothetical protein
MLPVMVQNESSHPTDVGFDRFRTVVPEQQRVSNALEQRTSVTRRWWGIGHERVLSTWRANARTAAPDLAGGGRPATNGPDPGGFTAAGTRPLRPTFRCICPRAKAACAWRPLATLLQGFPCAVVQDQNRLAPEGIPAEPVEVTEPKARFPSPAAALAAFAAGGSGKGRAA